MNYGGLLDDVKELEFKLDDKKLHRYAQHLNSSQILCYNFFRPLEDDKEKLSKQFENIGINIKVIDKIEFEYCDGMDKFGDISGETNFDYYVGSDYCNIYCEIKYTEKKFGSCKNDIKHNEKFNYYKEYLSYILKTHLTLDDINKNDFFKYYQLFRNAIRVRNKNTDHCLFIIPYEREDLKREFDDWHKKYINDELDIRIVYWETLVNVLKSIGMSNHADAFENRYLKI